MNKSSTKKAISVIMCLVLVLLLGACQKRPATTQPQHMIPTHPLRKIGQ